MPTWRFSIFLHLAPFTLGSRMAFFAPPLVLHRSSVPPALLMSCRRAYAVCMDSPLRSTQEVLAPCVIFGHSGARFCGLTLQPTPRRNEFTVRLCRRLAKRSVLILSRCCLRHHTRQVETFLPADLSVRFCYPLLLSRIRGVRYPIPFGSASPNFPRTPPVRVLRGPVPEGPS